MKIFIKASTYHQDMVYEDQRTLQEVWKKTVVSKDDFIPPNPPKHWPLPDNVSTFLDAGCGSGSYVAYASKRGITAVGLDIVPEAMKKAQKSCNGHFIIGDVRDLPFDDEYFDYVLSYGVVEHFEETDRAVREIYRVLKPNGTAVISVPGKITLHYITKIIGMARGTWTLGYEKYYSPREFKRLVEKENFKVVEMKIMETGAFDFPNHPKIAKLIGLTDMPLIKLKLGGRFIFLRCKKNLAGSK